MDLMDKIKYHSALIGVIGLGYVGLTLAVDIAKAGYTVIGIESNSERVQQIVNCHNNISSIAEIDIKQAIGKRTLNVTAEIEEIKSCDVIIICVPTPLDVYKQPDVSYIQRASLSISEYMHRDLLVILQSTTYPGTTIELVKPILETGGYVVGKDFYLAFSPERIDPGNEVYNISNTPKVVGGVTEVCCDKASFFFSESLQCEIVKVSTTNVAEMSKLLENTYRSINLGFINEFAIICNYMGINVWEVIEAAKTKPFGFQYFYPGPGVGGHCIALDPYYLSWKARQYNIHATMIETSGIVLENMPRYIMNRLIVFMNEHRIAVNGAKVLLIGIAYKANVDDYRESPALKLIDLLEDMEAHIDYHDPFIPQLVYNGISRSSIKLESKILQEYDVLVIVTAHDLVDYKIIVESAKLIFDTRNILNRVNHKIARI